MTTFKRLFLHELNIFQSNCKLNYRKCCTKSTFKAADLVGRDVVNPKDLSEVDVKSLLWTAMDMKARIAAQRPLDILKTKHITLVNRKPCVRYQVAFERAARDLGASSSNFVHSEWEQQPDIADSGRLLSVVSDALVVNGVKQCAVEQLAVGATIPIINCSSDLFCLVKALSDLMTLLEAVGPLRKLCLSWVGPPTALCNAYLCLAPKLKIDLKVFTICPRGNGPMSAVSLENSLSLCHGSSELHECSSAREAVYRSDVVVTSMHNVAQECLTLKVIEEAAINWHLFHEMPRTQVEISDDVFYHKSNLTWKSAANNRFVAMALLLRVLERYKPSSTMPDFDGPP